MDRTEEARLVGVGMAIAAAIVAPMYPGKADEILCAAGLASKSLLKDAGVDEYDIKILIEHGVVDK